MARSGVSGIGSASGGGDRFAAWPARPGGGRGRPCPEHTKETRLRMAEDVTPTPPSVLIPPYGDRLINLLVPPERAAELRRRATTLPSNGRVFPIPVTLPMPGDAWSRASPAKRPATRPR